MGQQTTREDEIRQLRRILPDKLRELGKQTPFLRRHLEHMDLPELEELHDHVQKLLKDLHEEQQCRADHKREGRAFTMWRQRR